MKTLFTTYVENLVCVPTVEGKQPSGFKNDDNPTCQQKQKAQYVNKSKNLPADNKL